MSYKLSFCIPTYNRASYLPELLDSIIPQITDELAGQVEICVSDNASTDNTKELISDYQNKYQHIKYHCNEKNLGADLNFLKSVEIASGEYCCIIGSDDAIKPGAISRLFKEFTSNNDIYLCNRTLTDIKLVPIRDQYWLNDNIEDRVFDLSSKPGLLEYFASASTQGIGPFFCFLSGITFKREKWQNVQYNNSFIGSAYSHVFMLFSFILKDGATLTYIKEPLVFARLGNDSFDPEGNFFKRAKLDLDGYKLVAEHVFLQDQDLKKAFLRVVSMIHNYKTLLLMRSIASNNEWLEFEKTIKTYPYNSFVIFCIKNSKPFYKMVKNIKKLIKVKK